VPIYQFLKDSDFGPEETKIIGAAYQRACEELGLTNKSEQIKQLVAKRVLAIAQTGERNPQWISDRVVRDFQGKAQQPK